MSDEESGDQSDAGKIVYDELHAVIRRYMAEAGDMSVFQMIGAIEAVKLDLMDTLKRHNESK